MGGRERVDPITELHINALQRAFEQRHPRLEETGEVELINTYVPRKCPYCGCEEFSRFGHTRIGVQRYKCKGEGYGQTFLPTTGTIFDEHRISISEWIEYCLNIQLFVGGMLMLGLIGEYIGRIYICSNQRFVVCNQKHNEYRK